LKINDLRFQIGGRIRNLFSPIHRALLYPEAGFIPPFEEEGIGPGGELGDIRLVIID
jgi:hypothetical protein